MFGEGEGYDLGPLSGRIGLRMTIVLEPPAFLEKAVWQADGRSCDYLGRVVHGATMAPVFAESVQNPRSYSGKWVKLESSNHRSCMRSEQQVPQTRLILTG
jgi:hypothetical protein